MQRQRCVMTVAGMICLAWSGSAYASAIFEVDDTFGPTAVPFASAPVLELPLFDPALGTLTSMTLLLEANTSDGSIAWDNEALIESDITLGIGAEVTATAMSGFSLVATPLQLDSGSVDADNDGAADFLGTDAFSVVGGFGSDSDLMMSIDPGTLAAYTGIGTFDVSVGASVETFLSTTGGFGPIDPMPGMVDGTITVTYDYVPIPQPAAFSLLAVGGALGSRRRRSV